MDRRTKIVATLGPATSSPEAMEALIRAGVNVVRLNFSHGCAQDHRERAELVRQCAARQGVTWRSWVTSRDPRSVLHALPRAAFACTRATLCPRRRPGQERWR